MPQIYRRHSEYAPRSPSDFRRRSTPQLTDADDSIVLSDLVRTGEASRLRRRGALRLEHRTPRPLMTSGSTIPVSISRFAPPPPPPRPVGLPPSRPSSSPWSSNASGISAAVDDGDGFLFSSDGWRSDWRPGEWAPDDPAGEVYSTQMDTDQDRRDVKHDEPEKEYILVCGGDEAPPRTEHVQPLMPSILPWTPHESTSSQTSEPNLHAQRTNGCGAIIHVRAIPHRRRGVWQGAAHTAPTDLVVSLDSSYFDRGVVAKMLRSACGCVREGVGCAVCGNPLGTRYLPCPAASEGIFSTSSTTGSSAHHSHNAASNVRTRPRYPFGPSYWGGSHSSTSRSNSGNFFVYTFFADRVSSQPSLTSFSPLPIRHESVRTRERTLPIVVASSPTFAPPSAEAQDETEGTGWYGFRATASPRPFSFSESSTEILESPSSQVGILPPAATEDPDSSLGYDRLRGMLNADGELVDSDEQAHERGDPTMANTSDNDKSSNEPIMFSGR